MNVEYRLFVFLTDIAANYCSNQLEKDKEEQINDSRDLRSASP